MTGAFPSQTKRFWRAYLDPKVETIIVYTRNLFYYNPEYRYFIRHLDLNDEHKDLKKVLDATGDFLPQPCCPNARHYLAAGDAKCVISLTKFLERNGVRTQAVAHMDEVIWRSSTPKNLILLGNKRTFPLLAETVRDWKFDFHTENTCIESRDQKERYEDTWTAEDGGTVFGVISRAYDNHYHSNVTILAGNQGSFFEGAGHFFLDEGRVAHLNQRLEADVRAFPPFEALLQVKVQKQHMVTSPVDVKLMGDIRAHDDDDRRTSERFRTLEDREVSIIFNSKERDEAINFRDQLEQQGVKAWLSEDIPKGRYWAQDLQKRFGKARVLVFLQGRRGSGETQLIEIGYFLARQEFENGVSIFPVALPNSPEGSSGFPSVLSDLNWTYLHRGKSEWEKLVSGLKEALATLP